MTVVQGIGVVAIALGCLDKLSEVSRLRSESRFSPAGHGFTRSTIDLATHENSQVNGNYAQMMPK